MSLAAELVADLAGTVAVLGVGNPARGDDGAGSAVARALASAGAATAIDGGEVPESFIAEVARLRPDTVLVVDAVDMGADAGAVALVDGTCLARRDADTHRVPLDLLLQVMAERTGARCRVLAIQPLQVGFMEDLSPTVAETVSCLVRVLRELLPAGPSTSSPDGGGSQRR